jgi:hypothetical protein
MTDDRDILFAIIDRETEEYRLLDQSNNVVYRYKDGDILGRNTANESYWQVKLEREKFRFYIIRYNSYFKQEEIKKSILPTRTLLLWAITEKAMYENPFSYVPKYDNCLEKYLVFRRIPKSVIKKIKNPGVGGAPNKYQIFYNSDGSLFKIEIYTSDMKILRDIVSELKKQ